MKKTASFQIYVPPEFFDAEESKNLELHNLTYHILMTCHVSAPTFTPELAEKLLLNYAEMSKMIQEDKAYLKLPPQMQAKIKYKLHDIEAIFDDKDMANRKQVLKLALNSIGAKNLAFSSQNMVAEILNVNITERN